MVKWEEGLSLTEEERSSDEKKLSVLLVLREELSVGAKTKRQGKPSSFGSHMVKPET